MKKVLGLDLGTASIGWALVNENENEKSSIIKVGVRVNPLTVDELTNFEKGKSITTNADRTLKRSMRRNLQRYKLRRENLIEVLKSYGFITDSSVLTEQGNATTFQTLRLRSTAASEKISLDEFARVLLVINKKRGYKSSRKVNSDEDGQLIDGMSIAKQIYEEDITPGQYEFSRLKEGKKGRLDFYRSDLQNEFDIIWNKQATFYQEILTESLKESLKGKNRTQTWAICAKPFGIVGIKRAKKGVELMLENYEWRVKSLFEMIGLEQLAIVFQEINGEINNSSGYLGKISDRSKELYFNHQTVGQYQMSELDKNPHYSLKNQVFYRQDYLDEFEKIWETQAKYHKELTDERKKEIRDIIIFYQRPLKSQKGLISFCELESKQIEVMIDGKSKIKTIGSRVCPKSSPIFQEFKIWQRLNDAEVIGNIIPSGEEELFENPNIYKKGKRPLTQEEKEILFDELSIRDKMLKNDVLKLLFTNYKDLDLNFKELEGNRTQAALYRAYETIIEQTGHDAINFNNMSASQIKETVSAIFKGLGYKTDFLQFASCIDGDSFEQQPLFRLWHLLYSFEGDSSITGNEQLIKKIQSICGFEQEYSKIISNIKLQDDYGNLSTKAIRKILPFMKEGNKYSEACVYAGYNHSKRSLSKEEIENKKLLNHLDLLAKGSLRNPVVEKILNQMINVINEIIENYGKPDEIRIELARELKKNAKEREDAIEAINKNTSLNESIKKELEEDFGFKNVSRNDILRYKLYQELKNNGYHTLYSSTYIPKDKVFSKEFDIEHIIPQAKLFDDSFSNKTLESKSINIEKSNMTARDFVLKKYDNNGLEEYIARIEKLYKDNTLSKGKYRKLLMSEADIPSGFIDRDLRDSQYIAKKAREILESIVKVVVPTTGSVTDRLREDWQLIDVMKELNWDKYSKLGLTETITKRDYDGNQYTIKEIKDWTKRNDHRHHAMDALTIAFTKHSFIQYLNNLNARVGRDNLLLGNIAADKADRSRDIYAIESKELYRDSKNNLRFNPPMPLNEFRAEAKHQLQNILVSIKSKNKVVTRNINTTKKHGGVSKRVQLTPRGQLHLEKVFGSQKIYTTRMEKIGASFNETKILTVANKRERDALFVRYIEFDRDAKKAFTGKNSLDKNPIYLDSAHSYKLGVSVKTVSLDTIYTIRKEIGPDLKIDKVIDPVIQGILNQRLEEYGGDFKKAFTNLDDNPIYLNKEKGITVKRVTITGINKATSIHFRKDSFGNSITDNDGKKIPVDFVNTGNNHHVAIYRDENGELQENVVSFYEATKRATEGKPIIDRDFNKSKGWHFLFTMKQNEYFVFPKYETVKDQAVDEKTVMSFNPMNIDLLDPANYSIISPNLYRVQKISTKDYCFRHHLETTVTEDKNLRDTTWKRIQNPGDLNAIIKIRVNHIGQIVQVGEY